MSLHTNLNQMIKERGQVTYNEVVAYCNQAHYKVETATRVLRASKSPQVEPVYKGNAIIAYKWKNAAKGVNCCPEMEAYGQHYSPCKNKPSGAML